MQILEMIELGEISAEEGLRMIQQLIDESASGEDGEAGLDSPSVGGIVEPGIRKSDATKTDESSKSAMPEQPIPSTMQNEQVYYSEPVDANAKERENSAGPMEAEIYRDSSEASWPAEAEKWRRWWMIPLWIGVGVVAIAGLLMLWAFQASGFGFWFICSSVLLAFGIVVIVLAAQSRTARWLHLRVRQRPGQRPQTIAISLPIPLRFARWIMRIFGGFVPDMHGASVNDILMALDSLEQSTNPENPVYIEVDEEDGERVEIFIG